MKRVSGPMDHSLDGAALQVWNAYGSFANALKMNIHIKIEEITFNFTGQF